MCLCSGRLPSLPAASMAGAFCKASGESKINVGNNVEILSAGRLGRSALKSGRAEARPLCVIGLFAEGDYAECAVTIIIVACGEEELIGVAVRASGAALAELDGPDVVDLDRLAAGVA